MMVGTIDTSGVDSGKIEQFSRKKLADALSQAKRMRGNRTRFTPPLRDGLSQRDTESQHFT